jgi:uncharacterized membrane protein
VAYGCLLWPLPEGFADSRWQFLPYHTITSHASTAKNVNYINKENNRITTYMSTLVVVGYDDLYKAEEIRLKLRKLQSEHLLDLEDAVVAVKDGKGKVKLHQAVNLGADGAVSGGFCGSLTGLIFLNATAGAASGALTNVGINDHFMKELFATLTAGSSSLFVLVRNASPEKVLEELQGTGGRILKTSLSHENESKLQAALSAERS